MQEESIDKDVAWTHVLTSHGIQLPLGNGGEVSSLINRNVIAGERYKCTCLSFSRLNLSADYYCNLGI
jgi:hypothetical protein